LWVTEGTVEKHVRSIMMKRHLPETAEVHKTGPVQFRCLIVDDDEEFLKLGRCPRDWMRRPPRDTALASGDYWTVPIGDRER